MAMGHGPKQKSLLRRSIPACAGQPQGLGTQAYIDAFMLASPGEGPALGPKVLTDVTGQQLTLDKELFWDRRLQDYKVDHRGREQYMRLLARAIAQPDEIWERPEPHGLKGKAVMRRRYFARWRIDGQDTVTIGVFEYGPEGWSGITTFQADSDATADNLLGGYRIGTRVYVRP